MQVTDRNEDNANTLTGKKFTLPNLKPAGNFLSIASPISYTKTRPITNASTSMQTR
jgi:hypothetical protein